MSRTVKARIPLFFILLILSFGLSLYGQSGIYDRTGVIPGHGSHGSLPEENIDLFTGNVTLRFRDVYLPGPNGLDVEVWRIYNSKILTDWQPGQQPGIQAYHQSWVGMGWTMHMGMVHAYSSSAPVIEFPDGRLERAYPNNCGLGPNVYMTRDFLKYDKTYVYPSTYPKVYFKNGVVWTLGLTATITRANGTTDAVRLVTKIDNSFGQSITVEYNPIVAGKYPTLKKITDGFGRIITFTSSGTPRKLTQISYTVTRQYAQSQVRTLNYSVGFVNGYTRLNSFQPPEIAAVSFEYEDGQANHYELKKMTTNYSGTLEYSYSDHMFYSGSTQLYSRVVTQKRIKFTSDPGEVASIWNYAYPDYNGVLTGTVNVDGPVYDTSVSYNAYDPASPWKQGLVHEFGFGDGSSQESYEWTCHEISSQVFAPLPASVLRHKEGGAVYREEYLHENSLYKQYGLASKVRRFIGGGETPLNYETRSYYFDGRPTWEERYMLAYPGTECQYSGSGTKLKEKITSYYDSGETWKWGAIKQVRVWKDGTTYADWGYLFQPLDSQGKRILVFVTGPVGSGTQVIHSYGLEEQIKKGEFGSITRTVSPYDSAISRESFPPFPDGGVLNYTYDLLGRVVTVDWPTGRYDETTSWPVGLNRSITSRGETGNQHIVTRFWDGMGRDLGYIEQGDGTTLYFSRTLDAEGRLVADCKGSTIEAHQYQYSYNAAGEVIEIRDPEGQVTRITLDGITKTVEDPEHHSTVFNFEHLPGMPTAVTDAQGHVAEYTYDVQGRLTEVDYNNGARLHSFVYDRNDNLTSETHPETGPISYVYNDENWLGEKTWGGATIHYVHNLASGVLYQVWWGQGYPNYEEQIMYTYNTAGRLSRVRSTVKGWDRDQIQYDSCGSLVHERITIPPLAPKELSYEYNGFGNLSKTTYPDQHWSLTGSNGLGMPETLAFDSTGNYLVGSAAYGSGKAVTSLSFARNGTQLSASYSPARKLSQTSLTKSGIALYDDSYQYDGNGNVLSITSTAPSPSMSGTFGYDSLNRLTSATYSSGRVANFSYTYDEYGNMRTVRENGITAFDKTYDGGNRIQGDSYDARGNLLSAMGEDAFYHWDKMNQLSFVTNTAGEILGKYVYDERGLRLAAMPPLPEINIYLGPPDEENLLEDGTGTVTLDCPVGQHVDVTLTIKNVGDGLLELTGSPKVLITGPNADQFSVFTEPSSPLAPLGTTTVVIRFSPTSAGKKTAAISIANNDLNENPYDIALIGNLNPPEIQIADVPDGGTWDFGTVSVGQSQQWPFMIQNVGEEDLLLNGNPRVQITGDEPEQFFVEQQPDGVITGGGYTFFIIRFSPSIEGPATAQVSIQNNDSDENPYNFTVTGTGQGSFGLRADDPELDITTPDGSEILVAGQTQTISWTGGAAAQFVRIDYSSDNGSTYKTIAERAPNTGRFDWVVPQDFSPACLIRISDADGLLSSPRVYYLGFDLKMGLPPESEATGLQLGIRVAVPDVLKQITRATDLLISINGQGFAEKVTLNLAETTDLSLGLVLGEWRHIQIALDFDKSIGSVAIEGKVVLDDIPLTQSFISSDTPELVILPNSSSVGKIWLDNLKVWYQDHNQIIRPEEPAKIERPIVTDPFDRYSAETFPEQGGWKLGLMSCADKLAETIGGTEIPISDPEIIQAEQITKQTYDQGKAAQAGTVAVIDQGEHVSPLRSFRFEQAGPSVSPIIKRFALPARLPYDVSQAGFSIVVQDNELADLMDKMIEERTQSVEAGSVSDTSKVSPLSSTDVATQGAAGTVSTMTTLSIPRTGSYYIYSFDGRLLAEYDIYGACLRDYIYMGGRLIAEFVPATGQYFYYMQDQIGSTRVVTNDSGAVVYAEAHDPYGGVQKTWPGNTFDPKRKFSDKERDGETGLDYFGARYYSAPNYSEGHMGRYRWLSIDPVFDTFAVLADPQASNLYSYCRNNPLTLYDPDGRIVICRDLATFEAIKRSIGDDTLADKITWNPVTGTISVEDIETDNQLYESLKTLVGSDSIVRVALVDRASYQTKEGVNKSLLFTYSADVIDGEIIGGWTGLTIFPKGGRDASLVHDGKEVLVYVGRRVLRDHKSEQAKALAEELYGHAFLYITGKPFQHELTPGGFVNTYINKIRERKY